MCAVPCVPVPRVLTEEHLLAELCAVHHGLLWNACRPYARPSPPHNDRFSNTAAQSTIQDKRSGICFNPSCLLRVLRDVQRACNARNGALHHTIGTALGLQDRAVLALEFPQKPQSCRPTPAPERHNTCVSRSRSSEQRKLQSRTVLQRDINWSVAFCR